VRRAACELVGHVGRVSGKAVSKAVLFFQLGADDNLYFLYASSLRFRNPSSDSTLDSPAEQTMGGATRTMASTMQPNASPAPRIPRPRALLPPLQLPCSEYSDLDGSRRAKAKPAAAPMQPPAPPEQPWHSLSQPRVRPPPPEAVNERPRRVANLEALAALSQRKSRAQSDEPSARRLPPFAVRPVTPGCSTRPVPLLRGAAPPAGAPHRGALVKTASVYGRGKAAAAAGEAVAVAASPAEQAAAAVAKAVAAAEAAEAAGALEGFLIGRSYGSASGCEAATAAEASASRHIEVGL
jgi:hypothetical protein